LTQVGGVSGTETTTALKLGSEADFGLTKDNVTFDNSAVRAASVSYDKGAKAYTITIEPTDQTTG
jgi:hypothetical protein